VPLGEEISLDPLEPADDLVRQPPHLGEVACAGTEVLPQAVLDREGEPRLEPGGRGRERLDGCPRTLERRVERGRVGAARGGILDALLCAGDRLQVHGSDGTTGVGWISRSSTTSCRRS